MQHIIGRHNNPNVPETETGGFVHDTISDEKLEYIGLQLNGRLRRNPRLYACIQNNQQTLYQEPLTDYTGAE